MISSFHAGFNLRAPTDPAVACRFTVTMLAGEDFSWIDMVRAFSDTFPSYLALVLLDESSAGVALREAVESRYLDLDRVTGDDLLVLSTIPPPPDWFRQKYEQLCRLPKAAAVFHQREIGLMGTEEGQAAARYNSQRLLDSFFERAPTLPCICFLWQTASLDEPNAVEISALRFPVCGFQTPDSVFDLFRQLASEAQKHRGRGATTREYAQSAFSPWNPTSLRWKNAALRTADIARLLKEWIGTAASLK